MSVIPQITKIRYNFAGLRWV